MFWVSYPSSSLRDSCVINHAIATDCIVYISPALDRLIHRLHSQIQYIVRKISRYSTRPILFHDAARAPLTHCPPHSFLPIVVLALVFNVTNVVGFTYACVLPFSILPRTNPLPLSNSWLRSDRDAKQRWASNAASAGWNMGLGGLGGQILGSAVKNSVGRVFTG